MTAWLGWTLFHAAWQASVIAIVVAAALWLTPRASASARYLLALAALALTIAAPVITTTATGPRSTRFASSRSIVETPAATAPVTVDPVDGSATMATVAPAAAGVRPIESAFPWIVALWMCGVTLFSLRVLVGVTNVRRLGSVDTLAVDAQLRAIADEVARRLGLRHAVRVLASTRADVPMVVGWLRPVVLVPTALLSGVGPAQLEMLVAHELAHIRRYDTLVNLAQTVIETLLFFHPAVWWISARVRDEREHCCDELAIAACGNDRRGYGEMLLRLEETRDRAALAVAATGTAGSLLRRVRRIALGESTRVELGASWLAGVTTLLAVLLVVVPTSGPAATDLYSGTSTGRVPVTGAGAPPDTSTTTTAPSPGLILQPRRFDAYGFNVRANSQTEDTAMMHRTLLGTAAAAATAVTMIATQPRPDFSGRWTAIDSSSTPETMTIEQRDDKLTLRYDSSPDVSLSFTIADSGGRVRAHGPVALAAKGMTVAFDSAGTGRISLDVKNDNVDLRASVPVKGDVEFDTWRMWLEGAELVIAIEHPGTDGKPTANRVARFRRAPAQQAAPRRADLIRGTVTDAAGIVLEGVAVQASGADSTSRTAWTKSDGRYTINFTPSSPAYRLSFRMAGYADTSIAAPSPSDSGYFVLVRNMTLRKR